MSWGESEEGVWCLPLFEKTVNVRFPSRMWCVQSPCSLVLWLFKVSALKRMAFFAFWMFLYLARVQQDFLKINQYLLNDGERWSANAIFFSVYKPSLSFGMWNFLYRLWRIETISPYKPFSKRRTCGKICCLWQERALIRWYESKFMIAMKLFISSNI